MVYLGAKCGIDPFEQLKTELWAIYPASWLVSQLSAMVVPYSHPSLMPDLSPQIWSETILSKSMRSYLKNKLKQKGLGAWPKW
jgi:hypothetical protein